MNPVPWLQTGLALGLAPLLPGVINRVKAFVAGRQGPPVLQLYYDLWKLLHKGAVYSRTTTWVFRAGPWVGLAAVLVALGLTPFGPAAAPLAFGGDLVLFAYLLGLARFLTLVAALDTGSSFEGMGASREAFFSMLAEPAFLVGLAAMARASGSLSLSGIEAGLAAKSWLTVGPGLVLTAAAWLGVLLAENSRMPVDDPRTHLELTMIHEVMVLDHGGPDFAAILYGAALRLWVFAALLAGLFLPASHGSVGWDALVFLGAMGLLAVGIGVLESVMARLRLARVPTLLVGALTLAALAMMLVMQPGD